jgi:hypothetical protein
VRLAHLGSGADRLLRWSRPDRGWRCALERLHRGCHMDDSEKAFAVPPGKKGSRRVGSDLGADRRAGQSGPTESGVRENLIGLPGCRHLNSLCSGLLDNRHCEIEHSVLILGFRCGGVERLRERQRAKHVARRTLAIGSSQSSCRQVRQCREYVGSRACQCNSRAEGSLLTSGARRRSFAVCRDIPLLGWSTSAGNFAQRQEEFRDRVRWSHQSSRASPIEMKTRRTYGLNQGGLSVARARFAATSSRRRTGPVGSFT